MKSGPTLKPATRRPRSVKAAIRPVATVVLPTPEWVPATITLAVIGSPSAWRSPLDSLLAADALVEGMLELAHLGDEVGDLDQRRGGVATGDDDVLEAGAVAQHVDHFGGIDPAERHRIGELVEDQHVVRRVADAPLDLGPALAGEPGPAVAHALPGDVAQPLGRLPLADAPLAGLHELVDADPVAAGPGAQHDAERGGGLAFALAGVDDQQRVVPPGARDALAPGRGLPGISGHATRLFRGRLAAVEPGPKPTRAAEPPPGRAVVPVTARTSPASGWAASASSAMHGPLRAPARAAASPSRTTASSVSTTTAATPAPASALAAASAAVTRWFREPARDADG